MNVTTPIIRYSPKPLSEYASDIFTGPAKDRRVDRPEIWNLAYLSHDYEKSLMHTDPHFLTHVRRTCQFNLLNQKIDMAWAREGKLFFNVMRKPAPWVVRWLQKNPEILMALPLYEAYGPDWFGTILDRSRLCGDHGQEPEPDIKSYAQAKRLIARVKSRL
ncbi:hypothetical protein [Aquabacterium sp.]|uniref:hypothetical protein n=1 Tax=Aquabacterium sp. TaxID=1872578 RepID=UPI002E2F45E1|nr:hypothetical protein [Aquabacterium sp.]HEX5311978.1 hypothetical protein [Aquabacterium sp.]